MARILLLAHEFAPFRGGIATAVDGLATGAAGLGHDVHVLVPDYFIDTSTADRERPYAVHRFAGDFCSILSIRKLTGFARRTRQAIRRLTPDIVHGADPQSQMALTALGRAGLASGYFFTVHGSELIRYDRELVPRLWMRGAFRRSRAIAAVSRAVLSLLQQHYDLGDSDAFVSYPVIAPHWRTLPVADRASTRRRWNAADSDFVLLTIARRVPEKGHQHTIAAVAALPPELSARVLYVIVGDGPQSYSRQLEESAAAARIRLVQTGPLGPAETVNAADGADLFVMASTRTSGRLEGFGLAYIEAAARGLPSIAVDTGGSAEAVLDGETGIVLPEAATADVVADAIRGLMLDEDRRHRLGANARDRAASMTSDRHAREVYDRFLAAGGRVRGDRQDGVVA